MKMMPPDFISHESQLQHLSEPSIFMLDVFRTADHAGQLVIPHRPTGIFSGVPAGQSTTDQTLHVRVCLSKFLSKSFLPPAFRSFQLYKESTQEYPLPLVIDLLACGVACLANSFIHSGYFYSASSSPLPFRGAPDYNIATVSDLTPRNATGNYE